MGIHQNFRRSDYHEIKSTRKHNHPERLSSPNVSQMRISLTRFAASTERCINPLIVIQEDERGLEIMRNAPKLRESRTYDDQLTVGRIFTVITNLSVTANIVDKLISGFFY